jgi:hypothetical protein
MAKIHPNRDFWFENMPSGNPAWKYKLSWNEAMKESRVTVCHQSKALKWCLCTYIPFLTINKPNSYYICITL